MPGWKKNREHSLRGLGINILLCVSSVTIFLGGAELLARTQYTPKKYEYNGMFEYDKEKVFGLRKNNTGVYWGGNYTTNSFGYRGKEISIKKPKNMKRILVVGDSVAFGHGVENDQTSSSFLERALTTYFSESGEDISVEVINTAVPGNSPFQEYYDLKRGLKFNPDVIILQITLNDIIEPYAKWIFRDMGMRRG